ncbi:MAG TPA: outer membrane beta-barrel family protein, partial [Bacteroidia bacterium]|nr:outer membrane beta-barrel family protein [Bacteroidia bacterium]
MFKKILPGFIALLIVHSSFAQMPGMGGMGGMKGAKSKIGHFYGKVVDSVSGKAVPFAATQISGPQWDSVSKSNKTVALAGQLTSENGEFSFDKLPIMGTFTLQISAIGYKPYSQTVFFDLSKAMKNGKKISQNADNIDPSQLNSMSSMLDAIDKDLGNIKLAPDATELKTVTVNGASPPMELKLDKRVFDVSKSLTTTGGTAEDVLKTIPAVNVDIDGNVSLRNASPTIYVDGLPTTLTIDQIPSASIDKIEVITNPSAKFDASAGSGGIINIVLKHDQALGYNGSVRAGVDQYGKINGGFDFNIRQGKVNVFLNLHYHQIKHIMTGSETRDTVHGQPFPDIQNNQHDTNTMDGYFGFVRAGFDYFINNRNTITVSGTYGTGNFNVLDNLHTFTYLVSPDFPQLSSYTDETSNSNRVFNNYGASILFKHLYPKEDENITASITANEGTSTGTGTFDFFSQFIVPDSALPHTTQEQISGGNNYYYVGKVDFTDPLSKKIKLDLGLMATFNKVNSNNTVLIDGETVNSESTDYMFNQQVFAAYFTFSHDLTSRLSYQLALRVEQSVYDGNLTDTTSSIPLSKQTLLKPFPGAFVTYHLTEKSDLQLSYTTHITRPSFQQLVVNNFSNPSSIQLADPNLLPAYQNSFELNYMHTFNKKSSLLLSAYYKITYDLITNRLDSDFYSPSIGQQVYINTYGNANYGYSQGAEATLQMSPLSWLDVTANYNLYESGINATNLNVPDTTKPYLSYFAKLNLTIKLPKNFTIQLNGSYQSKTEITPDNGGGGRWGGGYGGGITSSASGYTIPTYTMDAAIKKEFLKNNKASITLNARDVFATAVNGTYTTATDEEGFPLYYQTTRRHNLAPYFTINFSYRFGQMDISIFKRKNNNID